MSFLKRQLLWCVTDCSGYSSSSFHPHPQLPSSISNPSTFYPFNHSNDVTHTWSAVMFSRSTQGRPAGAQLVPLTSGFTQTAEHRSGGLPSPNEPCAQRRYRTFSGLCSMLPSGEPSLCSSSTPRCILPLDTGHKPHCPHEKDLQVQPCSVEVATSVVRASSHTGPSDAITAPALLCIPGVGCPLPCPDQRRSKAVPWLPLLRPISPTWSYWSSGQAVPLAVQAGRRSQEESEHRRELPVSAPLPTPALSALPDGKPEIDFLQPNSIITNPN